MIGPGNRLCDVMDAEDETERRAAITHVGAVAKYATVYHAGDVEAGPAIRKELGEAYGEELAGAALRPRRIHRFEDVETHQASFST